MLVVEDDLTVAEVVVTYLKHAGYEVEHAPDGQSALDAAARAWPDLVVLDLMLPGIDGLEVCRRLRSTGEVPVIMLTALGSENDRVVGLEVGADDYVTKPFSPRELTLRVKSVLRRAVGPAALPAGAPDALEAGPIRLDVAGHRVTLHDAPLALTSREFDLLSHLLAHPGEAFTREALMRTVWGWDFGDQSTVTVHVRRLREKIEINPADPKMLVTVWGVGYRFDPPATAA